MTAVFWCIHGLLTHMLWPPRAAAYAGVSQVTDRGDGEGDRRRPLSPSGTELIGLGLAIALSLVLPLLLGVGADALFHSSPTGFLIGLLVGVVAAIATAVMQFRRYL